MSATIEFLSKREAELQAMADSIAAELSEVRAARQAALSARPQSSSQSDVKPNDRLITFYQLKMRRASEPISEVRLPRPGSIKAWSIKALRDWPGASQHGLKTEEIISAIKALGGPNVTRNSMTPQLSRLKDSGLLTLSHGKWRLPNDLAVLDKVQPQPGPNTEEHLSDPQPEGKQREDAARNQGD